MGPLRLHRGCNSRRPSADGGRLAFFENCRLAEDSANRTHQRLQQPPNGFEDRPEHQSGLPSATIVKEIGRRSLRCGGSERYTDENGFLVFSQFPGRLMVGQRPLEP